MVTSLACEMNWHRPLNLYTAKRGASHGHRLALEIVELSFRNCTFGSVRWVYRAAFGLLPLLVGCDSHIVTESARPDAIEAARTW